MSRRHTVSVVLGLTVSALFVLGLIRLFLWRFDLGDVYPPYSSYRRDPLGCMAFFDALKRIPGRSASRFVQYADDLPDGHGRCLMILGCEVGLRGRPEDIEQLDRFMAEGGRVVLAFAPGNSSERLFGAPQGGCGPDGCPLDDDPRTEKDQASADDDTEPPENAAETRVDDEKPSRTSDDSDQPRNSRRGIDLVDHWGLAIERQRIARKDREWPRARRVTADDALAAYLPWHGRAALRPRRSGWETVYAVDEQAVVAICRRGAGSLVVVTDAYYLSNEAMRRSLQPGFLSWLVGSSTHIVFDETHFGIGHRRGIVGLARSYRLEGCFAALAALALLFIWQSTTRFLPPVEEESVDEASLGRAADSALSDLLRRHVRSSDLLPRCVETWEQTAPLPERDLASKGVRMRAAVSAFQANPRERRDRVTLYNRLVDIVHKKDRHDG